MYKVRKLGKNYLIYNSISTNIGDIKLDVCLFYVHDYDHIVIKQQAENYCKFLNDREQKIAERYK